MKEVDESRRGYVETRRVLHLAIQIERGLELCRQALEERRLSPEEYGHRVQELRRRIDALTDAWYELTESVDA